MGKVKTLVLEKIFHCMRNYIIYQTTQKIDLNERFEKVKKLAKIGAYSLGPHQQEHLHLGLLMSKARSE